MSAAGPVVALDRVSVRYPGVTALDEVSLDVARGEFLTLLGPSGSGKTTILNAIAGIAPISSGRVSIDGVDVTRAAPGARGLGMVFQGYSLMPHLNVFENVAFPLRIRGEGGEALRRKVDDALALVRLAGLERRRPRELSGGQQQRVALARALVYRPAVVLMDEPLSALDKRLRDEMQIELRRLHGALETTFVYVTHDQEEALSLSTRIALVDGGRIREIGSPDAVYFRPRTRFAATFMGSANLLDGTIAAIEGEIAAVDAGASRLRGRLTGPARVGARASVMFRAEALALAGPADGPGEINEIGASVRDHFLQGTTAKTLLDLPDGTRIEMRGLARDGDDPGRGRPVMLRWRVADTIVIASTD